ncbi:hypothetical protein [Pseudomonas putida]|uniref:hypothetical protein n=1 Tax=Pseudomonas putida TaxID=303 RepID=UPI00125D7BED|nr:hypothetical protein [Pseudomonas putida]
MNKVKVQLSLELILAFDQWARDRGFDITSGTSTDGPSFQNTETQAAWLGFEAAHLGAGVIRQGQQLYAKIKKTSEYAHQSDELFPVRVGKPPYGNFAVRGGPGGVYPIRDVEFYIIDDGKQYRLK